mmetsp:Transcript_26264/g.56396  ORF Transcript_26264/g.56396 Transcript_26264/m.56396 type:complete len:272 (-) Transcript_26264:183-998(-)|eukprot:CAMPEP_0172330008 /NCGR_PEP_ID=MMETSP1058-20130122/61179_1 /TAXON_ID=83371 /ORGANISM="Detonula confervacea, Strain CCMP 353" /LENGTH=271 /DNA_ID=CAMNT_0013047205 /DNA_START=1037 /DNA_END=1852 /DNA_ORIENTATION=-
MTSLTNSLTNNSSLRTLNLSDNCDITTAAGWQAFSAVLQSHHSVLETLDLSYIDINDEALNSLTNALVGNNMLRELYLQGTRITTTGWEAFSAVLRSRTSALEKLDLTFSLLNDDTLRSFANALANNNNLKELLITDIDDDYDDITSNGWVAFLPLLCNTSSIMDTYHSNHTLEKLGDRDSEDELPEDVKSLLRLNQENNKSQTARLKIIKTHFSGGDISMHPFKGMDLNALPRAIACMAQDFENNAEGTWGEGFELLYQLSLHMLPELLD